jgi:hypothetical protein
MSTILSSSKSMHMPESKQAEICICDIVLFCRTYEGMVSAAFNNALDWASRGPDGDLFNDKPGACLSAGGGARFVLSLLLTAILLLCIRYRVIFKNHSLLCSIDYCCRFFCHIKRSLIP